MPKKPAQEMETYVSDFLDEEMEEKTKTRDTKAKGASGKGGKKRAAKTKIEQKRDESEEEETEEEDQLPVTSILQQFGSDMKKTIDAKRRKTEIFAKQCATSQEKVTAVLVSQRTDRQKLNDEYKKQISGVLNQWEADIERAKESEEKLNGLINQQMKLVSQIRMVQVQRFKSMKQLHDQFAKSIKEVESTHANQHDSLSGELSKEMVALQKKFLQDSRKQEMVNMRKTLHSMLYQ
uniref:Synaptonemal complex protein 3-like n=1 Tax=Phallusia mammillata TaxID=59560 RepID=A0A6F9DUQ9_9ASCI|nr:synaptonemal complex protein 3-like [Phallusia mammillata]